MGENRRYRRFPWWLAPGLLYDVDIRGRRVHRKVRGRHAEKCTNGRYLFFSRPFATVISESSVDDDVGMGPQGVETAGGRQRVLTVD